MGIEKEERIDRKGEFAAVLLMAGRGNRFGGDKLELEVAGRPIWTYPVERFLSVEEIRKLVLVVREGKEDLVGQWVSDLDRVSVVVGGEERADSVWNGLMELKKVLPRWVLIHDCARILVSRELIDRVMDHLKSGWSAVVPAVEVRDTVKVVKKEDHARVVDKTLDRSSLVAVQTPQGFDYDLICRGYDEGRKNGYVFTDDAGYVEFIGEKVLVCEGDRQNLKLTFPEDWDLIREKIGR